MINFFLLCMARSARHYSVRDLPAAIPIDQILVRRHESPFQKYALLELAVGSGSWSIKSW
jgi:hypothetical protein